MEYLDVLVATYLRVYSQMKVYVLASWDEGCDPDVDIVGIYRSKALARQRIISCVEKEYKESDKYRLEEILDEDDRFDTSEGEPGYEAPGSPSLSWEAVLKVLNNELNDRIVVGLSRSYEIFNRTI